jgi:hypothetical protein
MTQPAQTPALIQRALRTLPVIHQHHWLKAALSIRRIETSLPNCSPADLTRWLERSDWDTQPRVRTTLYHDVCDPELRSESRWKRQIARGLVSSALPSVRSFVAQRGFAALLLEFQSELLLSPGYLGHGLSVFLGFRESLPLVVGPEDKDLLLERFVEFAATSLFEKLKVPVATPTLRASFAECYETCLQRPGFFGHHIIALSWAHRNQDWFPDDQILSCYGALIDIAEAEYPDPEDNVYIPETKSSGLDFYSELKALLDSGPRDVHALTLADALLYLFHLTHDERLTVLCREALPKSQGLGP